MLKFEIKDVHMFPQKAKNKINGEPWASCKHTLLYPVKLPIPT